MAALNDFVERRKPAWDDLNGIVSRASGNGGVRRLTRDELRKLGPLYRRAASDLSYIRMRGAEPPLIAYLNDLVTRSHGLLYAERGPGSARLWRFLAVGFPRLLYARRVYVLLAASMLLLGAVVAAGAVAYDPANLRLVVPAQFVDNDDYYAQREKNPEYDAPADAKPYFAAGLMANNIGVAIKAFAFGILGGFPTLLMLFYNGMPLGGLAMQQHVAGRDLLFWSLILPHGVIELTAIIIGGAAGMIIGHALIAPGERTRKDALVIAGRDAVRLLLGTVPLFIAAGFIESFVTPTALPSLLKLIFATGTALFLWGYFRSGHPTPNTTATMQPAPQITMG